MKKTDKAFTITQQHDASRLRLLETAAKLNALLPAIFDRAFKGEIR